MTWRLYEDVTFQRSQTTAKVDEFTTNFNLGVKRNLQLRFSPFFLT